MSELKPMNVAILGCGVISHVYAKSILENFKILKLTACFDRHPERMEALSAYGMKPMSFEEILEDPSIEMVLNLTSPKGHYDLTKRALLAGKHVYSEKTMTITFEESKELCALADEMGVRLGSAPDTFLGGGLQTARYLVDKGVLGTIHSAVLSLTRDYRVFGENLPHLLQSGGTVLYDMGGYYLGSVCSLLGPVKRVIGYGKKTEEIHHVTRPGSIHYGKDIQVDDVNVVTAIIEFECGTLLSLHMNVGTIVNESYHVELFGDKGVLRLGDPNTFNGKVELQKAGNEPVLMPFTHGFQDQSRGVGAAEMAWSLKAGRPHRASKEMANHVIELITGILKSIETDAPYTMTSTFERPKPLPEGFIGKGFWAPEEEAALI